MADSSLDDFFAKKDKSKKKSKSSKLAPGDILVKSEEPVAVKSKKDKKSKKERDKSQGGTDSNVNTDVLGINEGDWNDIEEEKEKDYSGLRIANLQVSEEAGEVAEDEGNEDEAEEEEEGEGETKEKKEKKEKKDSGQQGPWKPSATNPAPAPVEEEPKPKEEPAAPKGPSKYIPPGQRAAAAAGGAGGPTVPSHLTRRKKAAPNITSEEDFPTLGGVGSPMPVDSDTRTFERVQYGGRQIDDPTKASSQKLSLGNKFSALQD